MQARALMNPWIFFLASLVSLSVVKCQVSGQPQIRPVGSIAITAGQPVQGQTCGTATDSYCVTPTTGLLAAGLATQSGIPGGSIGVLMNGTAACTFSNTPVQGHYVTVGAGACVDDTRAYEVIPNTVGVLGVVRQVLSPTSAIVTLFGPATTGGLMQASAVTGLAPVATSGVYVDLTGKPTIPAAQVNSDWTSIIGVSQILNKPTLAAVATSGSATDLTSGTLPNARLVAIPNSALANSSTTVGGVTCMLGGSCTPPASVTYVTNAGVTLTGIKHITGSLITASNGTWSLSYTSVGCTTLRSIKVQALSPTGSAPASQYTAYLNTPTATSASGTVYSGVTLALLGNTLAPITSTATVFYDIICN